MVLVQVVTFRHNTHFQKFHFVAAKKLFLQIKMLGQFDESAIHACVAYPETYCGESYVKAF